VLEVTFCCLLSNSAPYNPKAGHQPGKQDLSVRTGVSTSPWDCIHSQLIMPTLSFALKIPKGPIFFPWAKQQGFTVQVLPPQFTGQLNQVELKQTLQFCWQLIIS